MTQEIVVVSSCVKKTCAFVVMGIGKKVVWARGGMGRGHQADSVLFVDVCVCLWGGEWAWWAYSGIKCYYSSIIFVTLIFHDQLHYCEIFLSRFSVSFVFKKAASAFGFLQSGHNLC